MQQSIDLLRLQTGSNLPSGEITDSPNDFRIPVRLYPHRYLLHKDTILSEDIHRKIERITDRLSQQEPIQYILGYTDFCGRRFDIAPGALIPRPETEELTRLVITENSGQPSRIADLGTGSGCIAVTLALSLSDSKVEAWDISTEALEIAQRNARKHNAHVNFFQRDILRYDVSELPEESLDIIVSNPPYIRRCESRSMSANVLEYEPHIALFVPNESPLLFYEKIAMDSVRLLSPGRQALLRNQRDTRRSMCPHVGNSGI